MNDFDIIASATTLLAAGFCKKQYSTEPDATGARSYCIEGALMCAARDVGAETFSVFDNATESARGRVIAALPDWCNSSPIKFNDDPATTQADVLAVMGKALEAVRQNELVSV